MDLLLYVLHWWIARCGHSLGDCGFDLNWSCELFLLCLFRDFLSELFGVAWGYTGGSFLDFLFVLVADWLVCLC